MVTRAHQPNPERLSVLLASILLALALAQFIQIPEQLIAIQPFGIFIPLRLNANTISAAAAAGMMAAGADWLMRDHPARNNRSTLPHLVLPALSAWIFSITLSNLAPGTNWWLAFASGGLLLLIVTRAEYTALDLLDARHPLANAVIVAVAYAGFSILSITLHSINFRLVFLLPSLALAGGLVFLRVTNILTGSSWRWQEALAASLVVSLLAAPLNYLDLSSLTFGILILAFLYAFVALATAVGLGIRRRQALVEPAIALTLGVLLAIILN